MGDQQSVASAPRHDEALVDDKLSSVERIDFIVDTIKTSYLELSDRLVEDLILRSERFRSIAETHQKITEHAVRHPFRVAAGSVVRNIIQRAPSAALWKKRFRNTFRAERIKDSKAEVLIPKKSKKAADPVLDRIWRLNLFLRMFGTVLPERTEKYGIAVHKERVLYLLHNCRPYANGGYAVRAHGIIEGLRSWGYDVVAVARPGFPDEQFEVEPYQPSVTIDQITYRFFKPGTAHRKTMSRREYDDAYFKVLCELIEEMKPSIIHAASFHHNGHVALRIREKYGIPVIYEVRGLSILNDISNPNEVVEEFDEKYESETLGSERYQSAVFPRPSRYWAFREEVECARRADHLLCITEAAAKIFRSFGVPDEKITILPNGVPESVADGAMLPLNGRPGKGPIWLGYIGSLQFYEGLEDLCEAVEILAQTKPELDVRVLCVGDGNYSEAVRARIAQSPCAERFELLPRVPHDQVDSYYARCTAMVYPRRPYPICDMISPLKPFEPMARGIPVIASDVAALGELVRDGETGFTFEAGNPRALADCITKVVSNPELMENVRHKAKNFVMVERSWRQLTRPVGRLYRDLFSAAGRRNALKTQSPSFPAIQLNETQIAPALRSLTDIKPADAARMSYAASLVPEGSTILDVGVRDAHFLKILLEEHKVTEATGVDIVVTEAAQERLGNSVIKMSITDLEFEDESFDVVSCFEVIEHLDSKLTATALDNLRRVCRRDLLISVPFEEPLPLSPAHYQRFTRERLRELFPTAEIRILQKMDASKVPWALIHEKVARS